MYYLRAFLTSLLLTCAMVNGAAALTTYDAGGDFSFASNPNSPWTYGYTDTIGGTLHVYTEAATVGGVEFWRLNLDGTNTPNVGLNPTASDIGFASTVWRPGEITSHPGPNGELSVIRFTAPSTRTYMLASLFEMRSFGGTSFTDVHILLNDVSLFDSIVFGFTAETGFNGDLLLSKDDRLDFVVGAAGSFFGDTTQIKAVLTTVPVPAAVWLLGSAFAGLGVFRRRAV